MKKSLREKLISRRDRIPPDDKNRKEHAIEKRLCALDVYRKAQCILLYVSIRSEVDTTHILQRVLKHKKGLILPVVNRKNRDLDLYAVKDLHTLAPGYQGIPEPDSTRNIRVTLADVDLVIVPGTGFDRRGGRLGYGGGYYDRLLSRESRALSKIDRHIQTVALAFEEQVGDEIPVEPHDVKVDIIVTDRRVIHCRTLPSPG